MELFSLAGFQPGRVESRASAAAVESFCGARHGRILPRIIRSRALEDPNARQHDRSVFSFSPSRAPRSSGSARARSGPPGASGPWRPRGPSRSDRSRKITAQFPAHPTNAAAHALEESARTLGIDLGPREEQSPEDELSRPKKTELDAVRAPLEKWVDHEAAKAEGLPDAPPAAVAAYFASHAASLDAIEKSLLAGPAPDWAVDLAKLHAAPAPNVLGHMQLARVLVGRAEARAAAKDKRADESLRAAFALTGALRGRPEVVSQMRLDRRDAPRARGRPADSGRFRRLARTPEDARSARRPARRPAPGSVGRVRGGERPPQGEAPRRPALRTSRGASRGLARAGRGRRAPRRVAGHDRRRGEEPGRGRRAAAFSARPSSRPSRAAASRRSSRSRISSSPGAARTSRRSRSGRRTRSWPRGRRSPEPPRGNE